MKNNEDVELGELMLNNNYRKILEEARYNPSKLKRAATRSP